MPIEMDGKTYCTAAEGARLLGIARETFNRNVAPHLRSYKFGMLKRTYYLQSDVEQAKDIQTREPEEPKGE